MEHLIEHWLQIENQNILRGLVFGLVHVSIMLIGYYTGWSINRLLKLVSNGFIAGIVGVIIAHAFADLFAALIDSSLNEHAIGIFLGGLLVLPVIPLLEKYVIKSKHHIAIGDHEDLKKDLKKKHK